MFDSDVLRRFSGEFDGLVNALSVPGGVDVDTAVQLGIARVSVGPALWRAMTSWLTETLDSFARTGKL